ncbi:MAG: glycosyltransferase family A protein, partial [Minisyncoccia bacterium]
MRLSLIIPAYNEEKYIGTCLEHALRNSKGKFSEIIVIDNASTDSTKDVAEKYLGVRVIREDQKGLTKARQRGYTESTGDIIAYIDADTHMPEKWIDILEENFYKNPN